MTGKNIDKRIWFGDQISYHNNKVLIQRKT